MVLVLLKLTMAMACHVKIVVVVSRSSSSLNSILCGRDHKLEKGTSWLDMFLCPFSKFAGPNQNIIFLTGLVFYYFWTCVFAVGHRMEVCSGGKSCLNFGYWIPLSISSMQWRWCTPLIKRFIYIYNIYRFMGPTSWESGVDFIEDLCFLEACWTFALEFVGSQKRHERGNRWKLCFWIHMSFSTIEEFEL